MKKIILVGFLFASLNGNAQIDGENVFIDQVIRIDLNFTQVSFWDSLIANYSTETDMVCGELIITDQNGVHAFSDINIRLKGNSSFGHPGNKKSFKIDFNDNVSGQNYDGLKKLNFNNGFKDPTLMREKIFFDVCRAVGVPAPRVVFANVYMNNQFWGFYGVVEQIDDQFLDWAILDDNGNLFKAGDNFGSGGLAADLKYYGSVQSNYTGRYELKTNETANDWSDLVQLIDFINNSTLTDFSNQFDTKIDKSNYLKSLALDVLFSNLDSYLNSARNYYIYHNLSTDKWEWIKWDGNEAFGLYNGGPGTGNLEQLAPNYVANDRPLIQRVFSSDDLYNDYLIELCVLINDYFNSDYLAPKIDEMKSLIAPHVYADNNKMFSNTQFDTNIESNISGGGGSVIYGLKSFVSNRSSYLDNLINCNLGVSMNEIDLQIYPNPFTNEFVVKSEGVRDFQLFDFLGRSIRFEVLKEVDSYKLLLPQLESGTYLLTVTRTNGVQETYKMIKN